jgi:hypothetical protein
MFSLRSFISAVPSVSAEVSATHRLLFHQGCSGASQLAIEALGADGVHKNIEKLVASNAIVNCDAHVINDDLDVIGINEIFEFKVNRVN